MHLRRAWQREPEQHGRRPTRPWWPADPDRCTITFSKQGRERRIPIDYLRNNRTNTASCAFSPRAPVSMPIAWEALRSAPHRYTLETVSRRLARRRTDPWAGYWTSLHDVPDAAIQAVGRL